MAQNPPMWVSHPLPHPPPYPMPPPPPPHMGPPPPPVPVPTIQGYSVEQGPHPPVDMRNAQALVRNSITAKIIFCSPAVAQQPAARAHNRVPGVTCGSAAAVATRARHRPHRKRRTTRRVAREETTTTFTTGGATTAHRQRAVFGDAYYASSRSCAAGAAITRD